VKQDPDVSNIPVFRARFTELIGNILGVLLTFHFVEG